MRTEDKKALAAELRAIESRSKGPLLKRAAEAIESIPAWISVRERTPRDMGDVLVVAYWHEKYQTLIGWYAKKSGMWHVNAGYEDRNGLHVTHWMPLPSAPEDVGKA